MLLLLSWVSATQRNSNDDPQNEHPSEEAQQLNREVDKRIVVPLFKHDAIDQVETWATRDEVKAILGSAVYDEKGTLFIMTTKPERQSKIQDFTSQRNPRDVVSNCFRNFVFIRFAYRCVSHYG